MTAPDGPPHDPRRLIDTLDRHGVQYLFVGGAAAHAYGAVRETEDAAVVVLRELLRHGGSELVTIRRGRSPGRGPRRTRIQASS